MLRTLQVSMWGIHSHLGTVNLPGVHEENMVNGNVHRGYPRAISGVNSRTEYVQIEAIIGKQFGSVDLSAVDRDRSLSP